MKSKERSNLMISIGIVMLIIINITWFIKEELALVMWMILIFLAFWFGLKGE